MGNCSPTESCTLKSEYLLTLNPEAPNTIDLTWTLKVCRIMAFYKYGAIILPTFRGLGNAYSGSCPKTLKP